MSHQGSYQGEPYVNPKYAGIPPEEVAEAAEYDPLAHNVDEVIAHMVDHPSQVEHIKSVERDRTDRKPRSTVLDFEVGR